MSQLSDDVVAAARRGDGDALRGVYESLAPAVVAYLRSRGVEDPEAVTHDVFLAVLPRLPDLHGGAAGLRTLTFSIAHARMVDDHRRRSRQPATTPYDPAGDTRSVASAEDEAGARIDAAGVFAVLDDLPADQREVLTLRVVGDLSLDQVATVIGRSQGAVKQLQRRAMVTLRRTLAERGVTR